MKKALIGQLKDESKFKFNWRTKVIWELQSKNKKTKRAIITATVSGVTKTVSTDLLCWVER